MAHERGLWAFWAICFHVLVSVFVSPAAGQLNQFTSANGYYYPNGNGVAPSYTVRSDPPADVTLTTNAAGSTTVSNLGRTIPTLVYNCAYMPFICKNIDNHIASSGQWKFNNGLMKLHYDSQAESDPNAKKSNNDLRRAETCEKSTSLYTTKGYPNGCQYAKTVWGIDKLYSKLYPNGLAVESVDKQPVIIKGPYNPTTQQDDFSNLVYTCDEFPSASWIEGGTGLKGSSPVDAATICAPQAATCGKGSKAIAATFGQLNLAANPTEQDWQGHALSGLGAAIKRTHTIKVPKKWQKFNPNVGGALDPFVGVFYLSTTTQKNSPTRAVVIDETKVSRQYTKRSEPTARPQKKRKRSIPDGLWLPGGRMVANDSILDSVPSLPAPGAKAKAVVLPQPTASPSWKRNANHADQSRDRLIPKGVYQLRGRAVAAAQVEAAQALLDDVTPQIQAANARKMAYPRTENNKGGSSSARFAAIDDSVELPTVQDYAPVNATVREAAALMAEFDAQTGKLEYTWPLPGSSGNGASEQRRQSSTYWYSEITPKGKSPFNPAGSAYQVYKNAITDCGAKGNGQDDDTKAIQDCIAAQNRCGGDSLTCTESSVMPLIIYFPAGTYLISSSIEMYYQTIMIGDPNNRPVLLAAASFQGLGVLSSDAYGANGASWYVNQNNFMRQVRNFVIDIRNTPDNPANVPAPGPACLHWQVAQATSLQNIDFYMREGSTGHVGVFMENGSGGLMTDLHFHGGYIGMRAGNQQFTIKDLSFENCQTGIQAIWDWTFLWQNITITGATTGIDLVNQDVLANETQTFAYLLLDSSISATTGIRSYPFADTGGYAQLTLDNVNFAGSGTAIATTTGDVLLGGAPHVDEWMWGVVATKDSPTGRQVKGEAVTPARSRPSGLLNSSGNYFDRTKPQYEDVPASSFKNALSSGCVGDGVADDTQCLQTLLGSEGYVFLPAGVYKVTDTIKIVSGVKLVGEAWSAITASGDKFSDMKKPKVMVQVGEEGEVGDVEISDVLFQVQGAMAGAVLVEWNLRASNPGSAGMWDSHFRVGGNAGSDLQAANCPRLTGAVNDDCIAASLLMHVTTFASGYFENIWGWTADHDLETQAATQIDIYSARGVLIESTSPTWFYASAFEHNVLYQYKVRGANTLFMGLIQSESPYFQSSPPAPEPFGDAVGLFNGDPSFSDCQPGSTPDQCMAWGLMVEESSNVLIYGAGIYSWYQKYAQSCLAKINCQDNIVYLSDNTNVYIYNLATVGTANMIKSIDGRARLDGVVHNSPSSNVSSINAWLGDADGSSPDTTQNATITLSKTIWLWPETQTDGMGTMTVACTPPCVFEFPPITYPNLQPPPTTTSIGGRAVTITPPAISYPVVGWEPVTYNATSGLQTVTPSPNMTAIPVPPWACGSACDDATVTFPPIQLPPAMPTDAPCWIFCNGTKPQHPPVVIGPGPAPGPPPPSQDDDDDDSNNSTAVIFPYSDCTEDTCPEECSGPDCTKGTDCTSNDCITGGGCTGPKCTRGGDCTGPRCKKGGDCHGDGCTGGGTCRGLGCSSGGDCIGLLCDKGGGCVGLFCTKGGGCEGPACSSTTGTCLGLLCGQGECEGAGCDPGGCDGDECDEGEDDDDDEDEDEDEDDDDDEEEEEWCVLNETVSPNTDTADDDGKGVSGDTGSDSKSGGNVGQGGVDGSGTGCIQDDGSIKPCQGSTTSTTSTSTSTTQTPTPSPYYDCKGETLCSTTNVKWCDEAVNRMQRGSRVYHSNGAALASSGNCWANWEGFGCSVQIRGTDQDGNNCEITGDDMWWAYQDIRDVGGCSKCGSKHFGNGCLVSIDYYYGCDNRDDGVN